MRVDALEGYLAKISAMSMYADYDSIVAVAHRGSTKENAHYHLVIRTRVAAQAFRVRMRKIFDQGKGNGHMSIKPWDGSVDAIAYLFHEDEDATLLIQHNVDDETITLARARNKAVTAMVLANKAKASWQLEEVVWQEIADRANTGHPGWRLMDEEIIAERMILIALRSGKYVPQAWHLKAMCARLQFRLQNGCEESEERFASRLARQIFHRE